MTHTEIYAIEEKLKTLGHVDYSQWERSEKADVENRAKARSKRVLVIDQKNADSSRVKASESPVKPVDSRESTTAVTASGRPVLERKECSTLCRHGTVTKLAVTEKHRPSGPVIHLLKIQIKARQKSLKECKNRYLELINENVKLRNDLTSFETVSHDNAKVLLDKYKKYRSAISILGSKHLLALAEAENNFTVQELTVHQQLAGLETDLAVLNGTLAEEELALKVLLNYKEKEYPEKVEQTERLKEEIRLLRMEHEEEAKELASVADNERQAYLDEGVAKRSDIKRNAAEVAINTMEGKEKDLAMHNMLMKKEIEFHQQESTLLEKETKDLEEDIRKLILSEQDRMKRRKHPHLFAEKCLPETEIQLRIPLQQWLPF